MDYALDFHRFWQENAASLQKPFSTERPRVAVSLSMDDHWLFGEMKVPSTIRYYCSYAMEPPMKSSTPSAATLKKSAETED